MSDKTRIGLVNSAAGLHLRDNGGIFDLFYVILTHKDYPLFSSIMHTVTNRTIDLSQTGSWQESRLYHFLAIFGRGSNNTRRLNNWPGKFPMPPVGTFLRLPDGAPELVVRSGQVVDVLPGMSLRTETGGTIETLSGGAISQCYGICGQNGRTHERYMHAQSATGVGASVEGFEFEFSEIVFRDAMRVVFTGDAEYVLKLPAKKAWVVENRIVRPSEDILTVPWVGKGGDFESGDRECGVARITEFSGEGSEKGADGTSGRSSILQFRRWDQRLDGPFLECLGPRPINTVADYGALLWNFITRT